MSENADNPDVRLVQEHLNKLGEHFDSVQIFATLHESGESGGTINLNLGTGNWFTRYGQVREWMIKTDEQTRIGQRDD